MGRWHRAATGRRSGRGREGRAEGRARGEVGFSLLEMVIAITIAATMLTVLAGVLTNMMLTGLFARQSQNGIDLVSQTIEGYRSLGYQAMAMDEQKVESSDPLLTGSNATGFTYDAGAGPEPLIAVRSGAVDHKQEIVKGLTTYTVWSYVTQPTDAEGATYKRVVVRVAWTKNNAVHERRATTFVSLVRRGLPLPNFTFGDPVVKTFGQGTKVVLPVKIVNRGARDAWNLTATAAGRSWSFTWYRDGDNDGVLDATSVDPPLTDTDSDAVIDTDLVETDEAIAMFAVAQLLDDEPVTAAGTPVDVTLKAVSSAQSQEASGTKTVLDKVHVSSGCPGCTYTSFFLHNTANTADPLVTDTAAQAAMPADSAAPSVTTLYDYDTALAPDSGRSVAVGGTADTSESDLAYMANWVYEVPSSMTLSGTSPVKVTLYATTTDQTATSGGKVTVHVRLRPYGSSTFALLGTSTATTVVTGASFQAVDLEVPLSGTLTLDQFDVLEVKVVSSEADVWLAYGTTDYQAAFQLPVQ